MLTKTLIHKEKYIIISPKDLPHISVKEIANVIVNSLRGIMYMKFEAGFEKLNKEKE